MNAELMVASENSFVGDRFLIWYSEISRRLICGSFIKINLSDRNFRRMDSLAIDTEPAAPYALLVDVVFNSVPATFECIPLITPAWRQLSLMMAAVMCVMT